MFNIFKNLFGKKPEPISVPTIEDKPEISDREEMNMLVSKTCFPVGTKIIRLSNQDNLPTFGEVVGHTYRKNGTCGLYAYMVVRDQFDGELYYEFASSNQCQLVSKKLIRLIAKMDAPERWFLVSNHTKYHTLGDSLPVSTLFYEKPNLFGEQFIQHVESIGYYVDQE